MTQSETQKGKIKSWLIAVAISCMLTLGTVLISWSLINWNDSKKAENVAVVSPVRDGQLIQVVNLDGYEHRAISYQNKYWQIAQEIKKPPVNYYAEKDEKWWSELIIK